MATSAATRWAATSGVDVMALGRNPAVAASLEAGIRAEALARTMRPDVACRPPHRSTTTRAGPGRGSS